MRQSGGWRLGGSAPYRLVFVQRRVGTVKCNDQVAVERHMAFVVYGPPQETARMLAVVLVFVRLAGSVGANGDRHRL